MTNEATRDRLSDHLLTPENSALIVIGYQSSQLLMMSIAPRS
jgi:hypothetical protein